MCNKSVIKVLKYPKQQPFARFNFEDEIKTFAANNVSPIVSSDKRYTVRVERVLKTDERANSLYTVVCRH